MQQLVDLIGDSAKAKRHEGGQVTLGYLRDVLALLPKEMPCRYDTGENFGLDPVEYDTREAINMPGYSQPECFDAGSATAYPSSYRGYYSDCTFNASASYELSNVGHVLSLVDGAIGKSFEGYKGGVYEFTRGTLVWGGSSSHSSTRAGGMIVGCEVVDGVCIVKTKMDDMD